jgi:hypothetical protein
MAALAGVCWCGGVRFEVEVPFLRVGACHCTSCKRISGGGGTVSGRARTAEVRILDGRELITTFQPDEGTKKSFCSRCGTNLFGGGWPDSEFTSVRLLALEEPYEGPVQAHSYVRSLAPWEVLPDDGAERYEDGWR